MKTTIPLTLLFLGAACFSNAATTANLLTDPGFETQSSLPSFATVVNNFGANQGIWGAENGSFTGTVDLVNPLGTRMHSMLASGSVSQTIQIVSLADYATEIAAGNATFNMSAEYDFGNNASGANGGISAFFFTNSGWNNGGFGVSGIGLLLDDDSNNWETISHSGDIPTNATWMGVQLSFSSASLNGNAGYVDNASLTITTVPEPSSALLAGLGSLGLLARRKRR